MSLQNDLATVKGKLQSGELTAAQANVQMIRLEGFRLVTGSIPADTRKALQAAVKAGGLGHLKKEGMRPEAYFHPKAREDAEDARAKAFNASLDALAAICC